MSLRILIASDAPWASSGYANQVRQFAPRLEEHHHVAILTTYGLHGNTIEWHGLKIYPGGADPYGNDVIKSAALDWKADIVITLKDAFVFNPDKLSGLRWVPMVPVDHDPVPPSVVEVCRRAYRPIAYARNGYNALHDAGLDPLYVPHTYDPVLLNPQDKAEARRFLGIPEELFIFGTVAVNRGGIPSRKAWPQNLEAFALFAKDKPNVRYLLHTYLGQDGFEASINLPALCGQLGILDKVMFCDQERYKQGFPDEYMNAYYNAIDVLNAVSVGEGFGIPTLEAQACGTPVIVGDWTASAELCLSGWKVRNENNDRLKFYDGQASWIHIPQPSAIAEQMNNAYYTLQNPNNATIMKDQAIQRAAEYQIDKVVNQYWIPALNDIEQQIRNETSRGVLRIVRREELFV